MHIKRIKQIADLNEKLLIKEREINVFKAAIIFRKFEEALKNFSSFFKNQGFEITAERETTMATYKGSGIIFTFKKTLGFDLVENIFINTNKYNFHINILEKIDNKQIKLSDFEEDEIAKITNTITYYARLLEKKESINIFYRIIKYEKNTNSKLSLIYSKNYNNFEDFLKDEFDV
ncbi:MAG: hypothetical protein EHM58_19070 [Ignavibacteriae bacterium]|nr:MAG: hypothetical protein EHM58_19070 [Ignavibacteriota bacterium]